MDETASVKLESQMAEAIANVKHRRAGRRIRFDAQITFNLMDDQRHSLEIIARSLQVDLSFVCRDAVRKYLEAHPVDLATETVVTK